MLHWKGFHLGLKAFAQLHQEFPNSEYHLIGNGPEQGNLESLTVKLGVDHKCASGEIFPGIECWRSFASAMCSCIQACMILEEGCAWKPWRQGALSSALDLGGPALQVTEATGFKLPAVSPEQVIHDLTKSMLQLARDPVLRSSMGESGRQRVAEYFTWDKKGKWIQRPIMRFSRNVHSQTSLSLASIQL